MPEALIPIVSAIGESIIPAAAAAAPELAGGAAAIAPELAAGAATELPMITVEAAAPAFGAGLGEAGAAGAGALSGAGAGLLGGGGSVASDFAALGLGGAGLAGMSGLGGGLFGTRTPGPFTGVPGLTNFSGATGGSGVGGGPGLAVPGGTPGAASPLARSLGTGFAPTSSSPTGPGGEIAPQDQPGSAAPGGDGNIDAMTALNQHFGLGQTGFPSSATPFAPPSPNVGTGAFEDPAVGPSGAGLAPGMSAAISPVTGGGGAPLGDFGAGASAAGGGVMDWLKSNPMLAAALGLGAGGMLLGPKIGQQFNQPPYTNELKGIAGQAAGQSQTLGAEGQQFLQPGLGGPLPPALEQGVLNALNDAKTATKAKYASLGLGNSTALADQLAYLDNKATEMRGTLAQQMAQTGIALTQQATTDLGLEGNIYNGLMQAQVSADNALEQSIAQFAGSLASAATLGSAIGGLKKA